MWILAQTDTVTSHGDTYSTATMESKQRKITSIINQQTTDSDVSREAESIMGDTADSNFSLTAALMEQRAVQLQDMCFDFFLTGAQTITDKNSLGFFTLIN